MEALIAKIGETNFYIICGLFIAIIILLVVLLLIEKRSHKKHDLNYEIEDINDELYNKVELEKEAEEQKQELTEKEKAQEELIKLEETLSKQDEETDIIGPTSFEIEQEESSIISYEELLKTSAKIDLKNEKLLEDEGNEPISIEDLYNRKKETEFKEEITKTLEKIEDSKKEIIMDFDTPLQEEKNELSNTITKFENSKVLSPVFGIINENNVSSNKDIEESNSIITKEELNYEIKKTEEFLEKLKELKSKLD